MLPISRISCARREQSTHALQSLELLNGDFSNAQARVLAGRLLKEMGWNPTIVVQRAFRLAIGRRRHPKKPKSRLISYPSRQTYCENGWPAEKQVPLPAWMPETFGQGFCFSSL